MYFFHLFRSFLPLENPIGFGAFDFVALACAAVLVLLLLAKPWLKPHFEAISRSTVRSMLFLAILCIVLRLALLPRCPVPTPSGSDDFAYILSGDTLAHLRLSNPSHPLSQFFETPFVLQQPTYSSIYPIGQGLALAIGQIFFREPWFGVLISTSLLCALCYWMLIAWTSRGWALAGGLLAVIEFGPLSYWMNSYWGGAVAACGGCLVFGSLPRLRENGRLRCGVTLGAGFAISLLTRPFESILLVAGVILYFAMMLRTRSAWIAIAKASPAVVLAASPAFALTLAQNRAVTGSWTTLPYQVSRYEYGVPTTFAFRANPVPHRELTRDEKFDYLAQAAVHGDSGETFGSYFTRLASRVRFLRFFLLAPLYIAFAAFVITAFRSRAAVWIFATLLIFALGSAFYPYFYPHYIAAVACLFLLSAIIGLKQIRGRYIAQAIVLICAGHFLFWYGLHLVAGDDIASSMAKYDSWDYIDFGDPQGRIEIASELARQPERQLVFVHYEPQHMFGSWIHNAANIDQAHVVWARDLGPKEDEKLLSYYFDRKAWMLDPDAWPPSLRPYRPDMPLRQVAR